jgi:protein TIF31
LLHSKTKGSARVGAVHAQPAEQIQSAQDLVASILQKSTVTLEEEEERGPAFMRWELGACWVQHLQSEAATLKEKKDANAKESNDSDAVSSNKAGVKAVSGLSEQSQSTDESTQDTGVVLPELAIPAELMKHLPSCALARLNESANLLQCKVLCLDNLLLRIARRMILPRKLLCSGDVDI